MAVENLTVNLGTSSRYDLVSAVVRGKTVPQNGQTFTATIDEVVTTFELENVEETVLSAAESSYVVSGREQRGNFLNRRVYFDQQLEYNSASGKYQLPTAYSIVNALGLDVVWNADDFRPTVGGMGWTTTSEKVSGTWTVKAKINERNVQSLLEKLFGWSAEFGPLEYKWHVRGGTLYIWQVKNAAGQSLTLLPAMCVRGSLKINRSRLLKCSETATTTSDTVETPKATITVSDVYSDLPYSGSFSDGYAGMSYSDGYLTSVTTAYTGSDGNTVTRTEGFDYSDFYGGGCLVRKVTTDAAKIVTTVYHYTSEREGRSNRAVPVLCHEVTTSSSKNSSGEWSADSESTEVHYHSLGNGFYGCTAVRKVDGDISQVQHTVSKSSPGGAASQYTERQITGYKVTTGQTSDTFPGYVLAKTRLPVQDEDQANAFLDVFKNLHGAIESKISAEVVGQPAFNPVQGKIVYNGLEYYAVDSSVKLSKDGKRMTVSGIRWDYDANYRINVLGFDD